MTIKYLGVMPIEHAPKTKSVRIYPIGPKSSSSLCEAIEIEEVNSIIPLSSKQKIREYSKYNFSLCTEDI